MLLSTWHMVSLPFHQLKSCLCAKCSQLSGEGGKRGNQNVETILVRMEATRALEKSMVFGIRPLV